MADDAAHAQEKANEEIADQARVSAEARRKRILENASKRNDLISGETIVDDETKEESAKNAARIRAARQRRYGKKKAPAAAAAVVATTAETPAADDDAGEDTTKVAAVAVEEPAKTEELKTEEPAKVVVEVVEEPKAAKAVVVEDQKDTKKYMGVAKMRRQQILKRKQQQQQSQEDGTATNSTSAEIILPPKPILQKIIVLPIYMHIFTIVLLFLAGVDVAFQPFQETVIVQNVNTLSQYGLPLIHRSLSFPSSSLDTKKGMLMDDYAATTRGDEDEFQKDPDHAEYVPNIDPLFRIDLDEYTKGSGIISTLGRGAVSVHRFTLKVVWHTPLNFITSIFAIPQALMETPPLLCVVALVLRQIVGKILLGANLVDAVPEKKDDAIDVLNMAKKFVTNFLSTTFPTVISMYDAFSHLRQDMYVILCGVFCGLAYNYYFHFPSDGLLAEPHQEL